MINFKVNYHNIDLSLIKKKLNEDKDKSYKINQVLTNLASLAIADQINDIDDIEKAASFLVKKKDIIVVLGTGGSNLGARALVSVLQGNELKKINFFDNIDPIQFRNSIMKYDIERTGFIIISKSGYTSETLSQFSSIIEIIKSKNFTQELLKEFIIITENKNSPLKQMANQFKCQTLDHEKNIGGRYSVFSNVGLLPARIAGIDISSVRSGANEIISKMQKGFFEEHLIGSQMIVNLQSTKSININVLITYTDALKYFGKWYLQLWAESIGKEEKGITPIHAMGTKDQHSQLQLYLDGPKDKFFTIISKDHRGLGLKMNDSILRDNNIGYLVGKSMGDLMYAEQRKTLNMFISKGIPIREIFCREINEFTIGQLMAYYMMETIATCYLIDVNPFDQKAVDQGKKLVIDFLS